MNGWKIKKIKDKNTMNEIKIGRKTHRNKGKRKQKERTFVRYKYNNNKQNQRWK